MKHLLLLVICTTVLFSCDNNETIKGNGNNTTQTRQPGSFKGIKLMGSMNVEVKKGTETNVEIDAEENIISYIETYVEDGRLIVKYKDDVNINNTGDVVVKVTTPELSEAEVFGSGDIDGNGKFSSENKMSISVLGSGTIKLEVDAPSVEAKTTGSGNIDLSGNTKDAEFSTLGSGEINAGELKAENATAKTLGSGDIHLFASVKLNATINGSGGVTYKGGGAVSSSIHGSGSVNASE